MDGRLIKGEMMKKTVVFIFILVLLVIILAGNNNLFAATSDNYLIDLEQYNNKLNDNSNELLDLEVESFTVSFNLDGGMVNGFNTVPEQIILPGDLVTKPDTPEKDFSGIFWNPGSLIDDFNTEYYIFKGWRVSGLSYTKYWDFDVDVVEEDTLLWADWEWPSNYRKVLNSDFYIQGKYWQNWDYFTRKKM